MTTELKKGAPVISLSDGVKLGTIDHLYLDPALKQIVGFSFHQGGGLFGSKTTGLIDVADVHAFGPDAVTIDSLEAVRTHLAVDNRCDELIDVEELLKREIVTEGGTQVGTVTAVQFSEDTYRITTIQVSAGFFPEPQLIWAHEIMHIGAELIVVHDEVIAPAGSAGSTQGAGNAVDGAGQAAETPRVRLLPAEDRPDEHRIAKAV